MSSARPPTRNGLPPSVSIRCVGYRRNEAKQITLSTRVSSTTIGPILLNSELISPQAGRQATLPYAQCTSIPCGQSLMKRRYNHHHLRFRRNLRNPCLKVSNGWRSSITIRAHFAESEQIWTYFTLPFRQFNKCRTK